MKKPIDVHEYDGYPMPNIDVDRKPLSAEEEKRKINELRSDVRKVLLKQKNSE